MSAWITDRLPTKEDADYISMVWLQHSEGQRRRVHYDVVIIGEPWQPITYPEPYVKPKVWAVYESLKKDSVFLAKNGNHVIGLSPFSYKEITAIIDALNRLEEGV